MKSTRLCLLILLILDLQVFPGNAAPLPPDAWEVIVAKVGSGDLQEAVRALEALDRTSLSSSQRLKASFLQGYLLTKLERFEEAIPSLEEAVARDTLFSDYALYALAQCFRKLQRMEPLVSALARLLSEQPKSLLAERARFELAEAYTTLKEFGQAELAYFDYLTLHPSSPRRNAALLALAELYRATNRPVEAEEILRQLWVKDPASSEAKKAEALLKELPSPKPFTQEERFQRAVALHQAGLYQEALTELQSIATESSPFSRQARLLIGLGRFHLRTYHEAIEAFTPLAEGDSSFQLEALYWLGRSFDRLGEREKALATWERLAASSPKSQWADDALYWSALTYEEEGKPEEALKAYGRLIADLRESELFEAALWRRGWLRAKQKTYQEALTDLRYLSTRQASPFKDQALYWQGRIQEQLGDLKEATTAYDDLLRNSPDHYYARMARERLHTLLPVEGTPSMTTSSRPRPAVVPPPSHRSPLTKARELRSLALKEEASQEYWELVRTAPEDLGLLAEAASFFEEAGRPEKALSLAKRILRPLYLQQKREPIPNYWTLLFPLGYFELVKEQAAATALDPYLLLAIIREESTFEKGAVSRAGARGLMQLLPATAREVAQELKLNEVARDGLDIPSINITLGTRYLAKLLQEFGDLVHTLAAYNAGPQVVRQWLARFGPLPVEMFVEEIPFQETRNYVKRVLGSYDRYRALYRPESPTP
ncbi:MAG: transglycosylase SLT domain-containing protein [candidate division NC10 bacterium]|nr:transglycosylase SLT domain-containing protein [candidate division NC10 bacterium]